MIYVEKATVKCVGWSLRYFPGWGNPLHHFVALYRRRAWRGDCAPAWLLKVCPALPPFQSLFPICDWHPSSCCPAGETQSGWVSVYSKSLKYGSLKQIKFSSFFCHPNPHWFLQPEIIGTYLSSARTLGWAVWSGAGIALSQGIPPDFYPPYMNVGLSILPLPPTATSLCHTTSPLVLWLHPSYPSGWMWLLQIFGFWTSI